MIYLVGVSHIKANARAAIAKLEQIPIDSSTTVFVEPKKNVLTGKESCTNKSVEFFFLNVLEYLMSKKTKIVPLNPSNMPSHESRILVQKYARQLAEEDYMLDIINEIGEKDKVVIIGNIHARRLNRQFNLKGTETRYFNLAPATPDDIICNSLRRAIDGEAAEFINLDWLRTINKEVARKLCISGATRIQEAFWSDEMLYRKYLRTVNSLMKVYNPQKFRRKISNETVMAADQTRQLSISLLKRNKNFDDHPVFDFPYSIDITALSNS